MEVLFMNTILTVSFAFLFSCVTVAGEHWDGLTPLQQTALWFGKRVDVEKTNNRNSPDWVKVTNYVRIAPKFHRLTIKDAAAIFWDLPGQKSYLDFGSFGLKSFDILAGEGTATVEALVTSAVITSQGIVTLEYPQVNSLIRREEEILGKKRFSYSVTWHSTDPQLPPFFSGMSGLTGIVTFEEIPGDTNGFLMVYENVGFVNADGRADKTTLSQLKAQGQVLANTHRKRLEEGDKATYQQLLRLNKALENIKVR